MNFYEQTIVAKHDLTAKDLDNLQNKYSKIITDSSGKVLKFENWGLISFANKIKTFNKGYYLHIKFQSNSDVIKEIKNKVKLDKNIIRDLVVKYKKLDLKKEYFGRKADEKEKINSIKEVKILNKTKSFSQKSEVRYSRKCPFSKKCRDYRL